MLATAFYSFHQFGWRFRRLGSTSKSNLTSGEEARLRPQWYRCQHVSRTGVHSRHDIASDSGDPNRPRSTSLGAFEITCSFGLSHWAYQSEQDDHRLQARHPVWLGTYQTSDILRSPACTRLCRTGSISTAIS